MAIPEEWTRQIRAHKWLREALPADALFTAIDHARKMSLRAGQIRKSRGIKSGIGDWYILWRGVTVWAEQKTSAGTLSDNQERWGDRAEQNGAFFGVFVELPELEALLLRAGIPLRTPAPMPTRLEQIIAAHTKKKKRTSRARKEPAQQGALNVMARARTRGVYA